MEPYHFVLVGLVALIVWLIVFPPCLRAKARPKPELKAAESAVPGEPSVKAGVYVRPAWLVLLVAAPLAIGAVVVGLQARGGSDSQVAAAQMSSGHGCVIDFYEGRAWDSSGVVKTPQPGERCEVFGGSLNPLTTYSVWQEYLSGRCVEFIVEDTRTIKVLGYC